MKRSTKFVLSPPIILDGKLLLIKAVLTRYLHPRLLKKRPGDIEPLVSWDMAFVHTGTPGQFRLDIKANHETPATMCRGEMKTVSRSWTYLSQIDETSVTNALFHALSGYGSSYTFNGKRWDRLSYIYG